MNFRKLVLQEGMHIFQSYGIKVLTIEDMLARLHISKGTLAGIAATKEELLEQCIDEMLETRKTEFGQIIEDATNAAEAVLNLLKANLEAVWGNHPDFLPDLKNHHRNCWEKIQSFSDRYLLTYLNQLLDLGIEQGLFMPTLDARLISRILVANSQAVVDSELLINKHYDLRTIFKMAFEQYLKALATEKGRLAMELHEIKEVA